MRLVRTATLLAVAGFTVACGDARRQAGDSMVMTQASPGDEPAPAPRRPPPVIPDPFPGWHWIEVDEHADGEEPGQPPPTDRGHGAVFVTGLAARGNAGVDTLLFHSRPDSTARPIGALITVWDDSAGSPAWILWAPEPLSSNVVKLGEERRAVPYDSADASRGWRRVVFGFAQDRSARRGWVRLREGAVRDTSWR